MKLQSWLILIIFLVTSSFRLVAQIYTFKNFDYQEGLNLVSILAVEESDDGYIWFGTDGAGLMRYDGKEFNSLEEEQGRNNRHVNDINFIDNGVLFSTKYRGVFSLENKSINKLSFINKVSGSHAISFHNGTYVVLQDQGLRIYKDSVLIQERTISPYNPNFQHFGNCLLDDELLVLSSDMNFHIKNDSIQGLYEWFGVSEKTLSDYEIAYEKSDTLFLMDKYFYKTLSMPLNNVKKENLRISRSDKTILLPNEHILKWDRKDNVIAFITNQGRVIEYDIKSCNFKLLSGNADQLILGATDILIDRNNDIWVTSSINGAYRISLEPFTNLNNSELFNEPHITFVAKTIDSTYLMSVAGKGTFIGKEFNEKSFKNNKEIYVTSLTTIGDTQIVSTRSGVYEIDGNELKNYPFLEQIKGQKISLVKNAFGYLWYSIEGKGLKRKDLKTGEIDEFITTPSYFYNGIVSKDSSSLFFGTNSGVIRYDRIEDELETISRDVDGQSLGSYVGNSIMDVHGTIWFSFDDGLMGITAKGKRIAITEAKILPSLLIYTLNADRFGNLIVGSHKGITVIKVSNNGEVLSSRTYNKENGFYGHETHMRSSFQTEDGSILLGTLSGVILVKPSLFTKKNRLNKPKIYSFKNKNIEQLVNVSDTINLNSEDNNLLIDFKSVNAKSNFVVYKYRLLGGDKKYIEWSDWDAEQEAIYNNLKSGIYTFEVISSIDGDNESDVSSLRFNVEIPFYKNKWFIIIVIGLVVLINILILDRSSNFNRKNIILSRDIVADRSMAKSILVFGAAANTLGHLFAPRIDPTLVNHDLSAIAFGLIILVLYFMITFIDSTLTKTRIYLALGFLLLLGYNLAFTYLSDIHPFYFVATLLVTFVAPYTLEKLRSAVLVGLAMGIFSVIIIFLVDQAQFNQYLFLMGVALASFLMIYKTYLRNNSLEQLIFTSGIVNKGNALVVAFDKKGKVSYSSENIELLLGMKKTLKGENVLTLNDYQPTFNGLKGFTNDNLINEFKEGAIFVTPLITIKSEVVYYQWSCKQFSDEVRIILGQDVTEKINLENYYELIVRNADDLIFQTDTSGNFTFANEKCCEVFARTKEELLGLSILDVIDSNYNEKVNNFFKESLKIRNKGGYKEFPIHTPQSDLKWLGLNLTTMKRIGSENMVTGFLGLARDITDTRKANAIIKDQNKDITASINYAQRIQFNMLPSSEDFEELFEDSLVLFRPKDIVSGDFFWLHEVDGKTIVILSDCTGHGVPGSFMTLLGINILNQIIIEAKNTNPGEILNQLDERLAEVLPRDGRNYVQDGMEVVVCVFDNKSNQFEYALAGGRFVIIDKTENRLEVIKGQSKHIGDLPRVANFSYKTEKLSLEENQNMYIFSDGYPDQFGGERNKKLTIKKFLNLINEISHLPMLEQNKILNEQLTNWVGEYSQTDDITMIGLSGNKF
ncbi:SpoIIE family protein phosphatase [Brumimicrobium mesophilum]|uniref:SpoIIE family protein phosphatase n=1 Tax=Brumimicrobium mesophilum TaxID=392717 RepID=UPI000D141DC4|nr:SpoIIE family protein phosphatase [Brumimicrobium mesophilum]